MGGVVATLGGLLQHQFSQEVIDRVVCAAGAPCVWPVQQSATAACTAKAGYPVKDALARNVQRLRYFVDGLATSAFQYSKASAVLAHIMGVLQCFL
jgi:hypothetical protein